MNQCYKSEPIKFKKTQAPYYSYRSLKIAQSYIYIGKLWFYMIRVYTEVAHYLSKSGKKIHRLS